MAHLSESFVAITAKVPSSRHDLSRVSSRDCSEKLGEAQLTNMWAYIIASINSRYV